MELATAGGIELSQTSRAFPARTRITGVNNLDSLIDPSVRCSALDVGSLAPTKPWTFRFASSLKEKALRLEGKNAR
jgi:hypothetical protein